MTQQKVLQLAKEWQVKPRIYYNDETGKWHVLLYKDNENWQRYYNFEDLQRAVYFVTHF